MANTENESKGTSPASKAGETVCDPKMIVERKALIVSCPHCEADIVFWMKEADFPEIRWFDPKRMMNGERKIIFRVYPRISIDIDFECWKCEKKFNVDVTVERKNKESTLRGELEYGVSCSLKAQKSKRYPARKSSIFHFDGARSIVTREQKRVTYGLNKRKGKFSTILEDDNK